jgi:hypothetical protein
VTICWSEVVDVDGMLQLGVVQLSLPRVTWSPAFATVATVATVATGAAFLSIHILSGLDSARRNNVHATSTDDGQSLERRYIHI